MWVKVHFNSKLPVCHHFKSQLIWSIMHEDNMKKLKGDCVSWLVLLTGVAQLLLVCGEDARSPGLS